MDAGRRTFNPWSWGLYYSSSVSISIIYVFILFITSEVEWSSPNRVTRTTLSHAWNHCSMARVDVRETPYIAVRVSASAREGAEPPITMN